VKTVIEVKVANVAIDVKSNMPVIILKEKKGNKTLPIWVGLFEAQSIAIALENVKLPRPLTHDLTKNIIEKLHGKVRRVVINDLRNNTYYARILMNKESEGIEVDSRPSDAIALALRLKVPIYIDESILNRIGTETEIVETKPIEDKEIEEFKKKLEDIKPEDFSEGNK